MVDPAHAPARESETLEERLRGLAEFGLSPKSRVLTEAAAGIAGLRAEVARLTAERDEADRRAGCAERRIEHLIDDADNEPTGDARRFRVYQDGEMVAANLRIESSPAVIGYSIVPAEYV